MKSRSFCLVIFCLFTNPNDFHPLIHPSNGLRKCRVNSSLTALEVLPGGGWDNLRNLDMGRVMNLSYSQCQTTEDGAYLIPDEVFVIPQKESGVETYSEIIMSWLEQKSSTSSSINADVSYMSEMNGKFSNENQRIKTHQLGKNSVTVRVQSGVFTRGQLKPVRLPPFKNPPLLSMNATNTVAVMTEGDRSWLRVGGTKTWQLSKPGEINQIASRSGSSSQMSGGEKAAAAVGVIAITALLVAGTVVLVKRRRRFS
ncbi:Macrophage-expressed gene 1 protein [Triplophysa tibetana]|uniref:Macrophage-expressed gene 1 protein n=1 Tax=Triplophysa tibetana TaxID=1572043 RepID=A0A5A9NVV7_9TELE|nr:Macrophage-expressed gene 1 protein [Triplophysa tibetana]